MNINNKCKLYKLINRHAIKTGSVFWGIKTKKYSVEQIMLVCGYLDHIREKLPQLSAADDAFSEPEFSLGISKLYEDCIFVEIRSKGKWPIPDAIIDTTNAYETCNLTEVVKEGLALKEASKIVIELMIYDIKVLSPEFAVMSPYASSSKEQLENEANLAVKILERIYNGEFISKKLELTNTINEPYFGVLKNGIEILNLENF